MPPFFSCHFPISRHPSLDLFRRFQRTTCHHFGLALLPHLRQLLKSFSNYISIVFVGPVRQLHALLRTYPGQLLLELHLQDAEECLVPLGQHAVLHAEVGILKQGTLAWIGSERLELLG
jgi:hypothetical protein